MAVSAFRHQSKMTRAVFRHPAGQFEAKTARAARDEPDAIGGNSHQFGSLEHGEATAAWMFTRSIETCNRRAVRSTGCQTTAG